MAFAVPASDYDRFMGRWSRRLAPAFTAFVGVAPGQRVLDVGAGTGMLTRQLVEAVGGAGTVAAIDPSPPFVASTSAALAGAEVLQGVAESLPWPDASFDVAAAQLVLMFVSDPDVALAEMVRVVVPGGTVAAATWDYPRMGMLAAFWGAVHDVLPGVEGEHASLRFGTVEELAAQWTSAGLVDVRTDVLEVRETYTDVDDCWRPLTLGVGPAGDFARTLDAEHLARVREAFGARLGVGGAFTLTAFAPVVAGQAPGAASGGA